MSREIETPIARKSHDFASGSVDPRLRLQNPADAQHSLWNPWKAILCHPQFAERCMFEFKEPIASLSRRDGFRGTNLKVATHTSASLRNIGTTLPLFPFFLLTIVYALCRSRLDHVITPFDDDDEPGSVNFLDATG